MLGKTDPTRSRLVEQNDHDSSFDPYPFWLWFERRTLRRGPCPDRFWHSFDGRPSDIHLRPTLQRNTGVTLSGKRKGLRINNFTIRNRNRRKIKFTKHIHLRERIDRSQQTQKQAHTHTFTSHQIQNDLVTSHKMAMMHHEAAVCPTSPACCCTGAMCPMRTQVPPTAWSPCLRRLAASWFAEDSCAEMGSKSTKAKHLFVWRRT